jgi:predicted RNA binding protein YcfA (HicA-like mRNA interferase family)
MPKLPLCSSDEIIAALRRAGFTPTSRTGGSHLTMERKTGRRTIVTVVVMGKKEVPRPTLRNILRLAEITQTDFLRYLRRRR